MRSPRRTSLIALLLAAGASLGEVGPCIPIEPAALESCDDGDPCSIDRFDPEEGCVHHPAPYGTRCDDGQACTDVDRCAAGVCRGLPSDTAYAPGACYEWVCDAEGVPRVVPLPLYASCAPADPDGNACVDPEWGTCDGNHRCIAGRPLADCNDDNSCTVDTCDPGRDPADPCQHLLRADGAACADGDPCTLSDTCQRGVCTGTPNPCDDGVSCTLDRCAPDGSCMHEPAGPCE